MGLGLGSLVRRQSGVGVDVDHAIWTNRSLPRLSRLRTHATSHWRTALHQWSPRPRTPQTSGTLCPLSRRSHRRVGHVDGSAPLRGKWGRRLDRHRPTRMPSWLPRPAEHQSHHCGLHRYFGGPPWHRRLSHGRRRAALSRWLCQRHGRVESPAASVAHDWPRGFDRTSTTHESPRHRTRRSDGSVGECLCGVAWPPEQAGYCRRGTSLRDDGGPRQYHRGCDARSPFSSARGLGSH